MDPEFGHKKGLFLREAEMPSDAQQDDRVLKCRPPNRADHFPLTILPSQISRPPLEENPQVDQATAER
jgi:hypothetical protein